VLSTAKDLLHTFDQAAESESMTYCRSQRDMVPLGVTVTCQALDIKYWALLLTMSSSRDSCLLCCVPFGDRSNTVSSGMPFRMSSGLALRSEICSGLKHHQILQMALRKSLDSFARSTKHAFETQAKEIQHGKW